MKNSYIRTWARDIREASWWTRIYWVVIVLLTLIGFAYTWHEFHCRSEMKKLGYYTGKSITVSTFPFCACAGVEFPPVPKR